MLTLGFLALCYNIHGHNVQSYCHIVTGYEDHFMTDENVTRISTSKIFMDRIVFVFLSTVGADTI